MAEALSRLPPARPPASQHRAGAQAEGAAGGRARHTVRAQPAPALPALERPLCLRAEHTIGGDAEPPLQGRHAAATRAAALPGAAGSRARATTLEHRAAAHAQRAASGRPGDAVGHQAVRALPALRARARSGGRTPRRQRSPAPAAARPHRHHAIVFRLPGRRSIHRSGHRPWRPRQSPTPPAPQPPTARAWTAAAVHGGGPPPCGGSARASASAATGRGRPCPSQPEAADRGPPARGRCRCGAGARASAR